MLRGETKNRFDAQFYKLKLDFSNCISLKNFVKVKGGKRIPKGLSYSDTDTDFLYLRVENLKNECVDFKKIKHISESIYKILKRYEVVENNIIISNAGTIGKIALFKNNTGKPVILTENCAKLIIIDIKQVLPEYLTFVLKSDFVQQQIELDYVQTTIPKLALERIENLQIPTLPTISLQKEIVTKFNIAISEKQEKENEAKLLLSSFEEYILKEFDIKLPKIEFVEQIIVNLQQLENALNVERYAISFDKSTLKWTTINSIGEVKLDTIAPSSELYKNIDFTLMRIDDLPNKPQKAEIRKVQGNQIAGNVQKVKENDILVARLEPTIVNKKIVSVPKSQNDILASNEFIRLTCNEQNNPLFVKYMLQTDFYTQLMTSKTRGATPSRRRLSRIDFEHLPFPNIDKAIQDKIAFEFETRILKAMKLKKEAKENYNETKSKIENMIINKD